MSNLNVHGYIFTYIYIQICNIFYVYKRVCVCVPIMAGESPLFAEVPTRDTTQSLSKNWSSIRLFYAIHQLTNFF